MFLRLVLKLPEIPSEACLNMLSSSKGPECDSIFSWRDCALVEPAAMVFPKQVCSRCERTVFAPYPAAIYFLERPFKINGPEKLLLLVSGQFKIN